MSMTADIMARLGLDKSEFSRGIAEAQRDAKGLADVAAGIGGRLAGMFATGAVAAFVVKQGEAAEATLNTSRALGISAEQFQAATRAATLNNSSTEAMTAGLSKLQKALGEAKNGSVGALADFRALGIEQEKLAGMDLAGAVQAVADAWAAGGSDAQTYAAVQGLIGKGALELKATFDEIAEKSLPGMTEEMKKAGLVLDAETLASLNAANSVRERMLAKISVGGGDFFGKLLGGLGVIGNRLSGSFDDSNIFGEDEDITVTEKQRTAARARAKLLADVAQKAKEEADAKAQAIADKPYYDAVARRIKLEEEAANARLTGAQRVARMEREIEQARADELSPDKLTATNASIRILELTKAAAEERKRIAADEARAADERLKAEQRIAELRERTREQIRDVFTRGPRADELSVGASLGSSLSTADARRIALTRAEIQKSAAETEALRLNRQLATDVADIKRKLLNPGPQAR